MQTDKRDKLGWTQLLLGCAFFAPPALVFPGYYVLSAMGWLFLGQMLWAGVVLLGTFILVLPWARAATGPLFSSCLSAAGIAFAICFGWVLLGFAFLYVLCSNTRF